MALIFFDIDGTLWDGHMQIPESTIPTLKKLQANGHKIFSVQRTLPCQHSGKRVDGCGL